MLMTLTKNTLKERIALTDLAESYQSSIVLLTAAELGVFEFLHDHGASTAYTAAKELKSDPRNMKILLNGLVALDLLTMKESKYNLTGTSLQFLTPSSRYYVGDILRHHRNLLKSWVKMLDVVRSGAPAYNKNDKDERTPDELRSFILGMDNISHITAQQIRDHLDFSDVKKILDLGGGPGTYLISFLEEAPKIRGTLLDRPNVIPIATEKISRAEMLDRIDFIEGDMFKADFGGPYDMVFLGNIIHSWGANENLQLLLKIKNALQERGRIIIKDFFTDSTGSQPPKAALFSLNMMVNTTDGQSWPMQIVEGWLMECGFTPISLFRVGAYSSVLVAEKNPK